MSFINEYKKYQVTFEKWLSSMISKDTCPQTSIHKAMEYSLMAGGKRIRPVLTLAVNDMLKGDGADIMPYAGAIELIHTYSLIHDDLPCMDNDDFRRGKPTNHKVFGEAMAVLAGDGLLNLAFEIMLMDIVKEKNTCHQKSETARMIAGAAGVSGMIGGQVIDIEAENKDISYDELCDMHRKKTGALIKASVIAPVTLLNADAEILNSLEVYADNIGLAFQIKDDILDYEGSREVVGKSIGKDEKSKKATFVSKLGIEMAKELLKTSVEKAVEAIKTIDENDFLIKTAVFIAQRDR